MLFWGIVATIWIYIPNDAIGKDMSDMAVASASMLVSNQQAQSFQDLIPPLSKDNPYETPLMAYSPGL
jgi:hypothetical protein